MKLPGFNVARTMLMMMIVLAVMSTLSVAQDHHNRGKPNKEERSLYRLRVSSMSAQQTSEITPTTTTNRATPMPTEPPTSPSSDSTPETTSTKSMDATPSSLPLPLFSDSDESNGIPIVLPVDSDTGKVVSSSGGPKQGSGMTTTLDQLVGTLLNGTTDTSMEIVDAEAMNSTTVQSVTSSSTKPKPNLTTTLDVLVGLLNDTGTTDTSIKDVDEAPMNSTTVETATSSGNMPGSDLTTTLDALVATLLNGSTTDISLMEGLDAMLMNSKTSDTTMSSSNGTMQGFDLMMTTMDLLELLLNGTGTTDNGVKGVDIILPLGNTSMLANIVQDIDLEQVGSLLLDVVLQVWRILNNSTTTDQWLDALNRALDGNTTLLGTLYMTSDVGNSLDELLTELGSILQSNATMDIVETISSALAGNTTSSTILVNEVAPLVNVLMDVVGTLLGDNNATDAWSQALLTALDGDGTMLTSMLNSTGLGELGKVIVGVVGSLLSDSNATDNWMEALQSTLNGDNAMLTDMLNATGLNEMSNLVMGVVGSLLGEDAVGDWVTAISDALNGDATMLNMLLESSGLADIVTMIMDLLTFLLGDSSAMGDMTNGMN
jgi:uncharacterized membrane protein YeaQ/YmgE (transglycosylase-associated protein family)